MGRPLAEIVAMVGTTPHVVQNVVYHYRKETASRSARRRASSIRARSGRIIHGSHNSSACRAGHSALQSNANMPSSRRASHARRSPAAADDQGPKYDPPVSDRVCDTNLASLLGGLRSIVPEQQLRLGFEENPAGFRLWCVGDVSLIRQRAVAIVGTREVSQ
jgi:hypothetical protein